MFQAIRVASAIAACMPAIVDGRGNSFIIVAVEAPSRTAAGRGTDYSFCPETMAENARLGLWPRG